MQERRSAPRATYFVGGSDRCPRGAIVVGNLVLCLGTAVELLRSLGAN